MSAPEAAEILAAVGRRIQIAFAVLDAYYEIPRQGGSFQASLSDTSHRFNLWTRSVGLYQEGQGSLDYQFRDAPSVYDYTHELLVKLEKSLLTSIFPLCCLACTLPTMKSSLSSGLRVWLTVPKYKMTFIARSSHMK